MPKLAAFLALLLTAAPSFALAAAGPIRVTDGWVKASLAGQGAGSAYLVLTNTGRAADRLLEGTSPASARVTPHHMAVDRGVMVMRKLEGVALAPGARVAFTPGGDHLMLEGLKRPLRAGETVAITLRFQHAGAVAVRLPVRAAAPDAMPGMGR